MCSLKKINRCAFYLGVDLLEGFYKASVDLQRLIYLVIYLIKGAIFQPNYAISSLGRISLDICLLSKLIDIYYTYKATKRYNKVYALLSISSNNLSKVSILPNYRVLQEELLQQLSRFLFYKKVLVESQEDKDIAVIKSKGYILSKLLVKPYSNRQNVDIMFLNVLEQLEYKGE